MPQKKLTKISVGGITEAIKQLEYTAGMLQALDDLLRSSPVEEIEVPYYANFEEGIRRVEVFASSATQAYHKAMRDRHIQSE